MPTQSTLRYLKEKAKLKRLNAYQFAAIVQRAHEFIQDAIDETRDSEGWEGTDPTWWPTRADVREALRASESKWIDPRGGWAGIADYPKYEKVVTSLMDYFSKQKREV